MEGPIISGIAHDASQAKVTIVGLPDKPGTAAHLFEVIAASGANIDMITQNRSVDDSKCSNLSFTLPAGELQDALDALTDAQDDLKFRELRAMRQVGKLSLVGAGMRTHTGVSATLFGALAQAGINIEMISTSEIRISVVTDYEDLPNAVRVVHNAFGLDAEDTEAVVYGGTGR